MQLQKDPLTIHWGLEEEANLPLKSTSTGSVVQIGNREFVGITQHSLVRFETSVISNYLPYQLSALVSIRDQQILVGVTAISAEFVVILLNDIKKPIYPKIKTNDASIFNMIYLPKSSLLITSGEDLKVWHFDYYYNTKSIIPTEPRLKIEYQRTIITKFQGSIMNPPIVDFQTEILYIDDKNGSLQMYKASTGENIGCALKFQSKSNTTIAINSESKKFLASNADQGTVLYNKSRSFCKRFLLSNIATLAIRFINKEYAILLDANNKITILDIKTSRSFVCYKGEKPIKRIFLFEQPTPRLILCFNTNIVIFRIVLPWKYWKTTISTPLSMVRCSKYNEAARLLVMCSNSHIKLMSPSLKATLTAVTLSSLSSPISNGYFYDRGTEEIQRDQLMIPLKDGQIQIFSTGENPCKLISSLDAKAMCISLCRYKNKKCFVFGTSNGNLLFYDYETLTKVHRVVLVPYPIIKIFYCRSPDDDDEIDDDFDDSLCLVFDDQLAKYSIRDDKISEFIKINGSEISISFNDIMLFGYENGEIGSVYFDKSTNCNLSEHSTNGLKIHDDKITGFSLGLDSDYFVSSSLDMSIRIWTTKDITLIKKIVFPIQLISVAVLNGKRDVVVGTDYEIMFVSGELLFKGIVDDEDSELDNYDKKCDFLSNQYSQIGKEEQENEGGFLDGRKYRTDENDGDGEIKKKKKPINNKFRKIAEALKKHEEMLNQQMNEYSNNEEQNKQPQKKTVMDPDERERLYNQMTEITNGKPKKTVIPKSEKVTQNIKKEDQYEYEYEYENDYSEDLNESNSESENKNEDSAKSDSNNNNDNDITIIKNDSVEYNDDESIQIKNDTDKNDDTDIKTRMPSNKYSNRSPKRNLRRARPQNLISSSNKSQNGSLSNSNGNSEQFQNESDLQSSYNESDYYSNYSYEYDLYDYYEDENGEKKFHKRKCKHRHKHKHTHKNHSKKNLENDVENENRATSNGENNSKHNHFKIGSKNKNKSNFETDKSLADASSKNEKKNSKNKTKNNINNNNNHEQNQKSSTRIHNPIDHRTKMNLLLVNSSISDAYNNTNNDQINEQNINYRNKQKDIKSNSSLDRKIFLNNQNQGPMIKIKATRRFPTPLGYHFVHPGLSLFERSLKPRRPRTPDKQNNGLIISRSVVPTNIILDATALDNIIENNDTRYRPLLNQIRPLLRSHYNYYSAKMRNINRIHAFFNLNVMLPVYQRNRQQIQNQIKELSRITNTENKNENLKNSSFIVPPINIEELSMNENQSNLKSKKERKNNHLTQSEKPSTNRNCIFQNESKPRSLLDIGKIRHSYDNKNIYSTRTKINAVSPRIYRLDKNKMKRKASCPPRIHHPIILSPLPQTERKNNAESAEYNKFISSLCNQKDKKVLHRKQKSLSVDLPSDSLYVTGKLMMHENSKYQRIHKMKNNEDNKNENNEISTNE